MIQWWRLVTTFLFFGDRFASPFMFMLYIFVAALRVFISRIPRAASASIFCSTCTFWFVLIPSQLPYRALLCSSPALTHHLSPDQVRYSTSLEQGAFFGSITCPPSHR
jgi:hypothetical protein